MFKHTRRKEYRTWVGITDTLLVLFTAGWWFAVIIPREILQHRPS